MYKCMLSLLGLAQRAGQLALAEEYQTDCVEAVSKIELGTAIGREFRAVVVILDEGFKKGIHKKLKTLKGEM